MILFWVLIFVASLYLLVKSADYLIESSEKLGLFWGFSPFVIGVVLVALGTSLPELFFAIFVVFRGFTEGVVANVIGSNISNMLLVVGLTVVFGGKLAVTKDLIDTELPILALSSVIFLAVVSDGQVNFFEALILIAGFIIYIFYSISAREKKLVSEEGIGKIDFGIIFKFSGGVFGLLLGANSLVEAVINLSTGLNLNIGIITIIAVSLGTSLPELSVSLKAALLGKSEVALGNIFGSNIFNLLLVVGLPGLFSTLLIDEQTYNIGLPALMVVTLLFVISGISKRINTWEGMFFLLLYLLFVGKILNVF